MIIPQLLDSRGTRLSVPRTSWQLRVHSDDVEFHQSSRLIDFASAPLDEWKDFRGITERHPLLGSLGKGNRRCSHEADIVRADFIGSHSCFKQGSDRPTSAPWSDPHRFVFYSRGIAVNFPRMNLRSVSGSVAFVGSESVYAAPGLASLG